ncbi:hypothetical protein D6T64_16430 [Cryobacterium melibiosiphilum]|uniref:J domain-containing protein n=1 Tax=Cryobacterium melibiosiphilum TaxID=995039 RepID=A0A3A5MCX4_9MICO|nr:J domain-containing protein [Cryobacterium melibiosiphilum]RJT87025.1 hypothetical protein D6T64_16430 [Cryobacterium melibiosiphilum]
MTPSEAAAILNVGGGASVADIDRAFQRRARASHPDRFVGATDADIRAATAEFVRLIEARDLMRAAAPRAAPRPTEPRDPADAPPSGRPGEPLSFAEFVQIRDARAWLAPSVARSTTFCDDAPSGDAPRRAHHEWVVLPVVFVVLTVAIWGLTILLPG